MALTLPFASTSVAAGAASPDAAGRHLLAAQRQAAAQPALEARRKAWCDPAAAPSDAVAAARAVDVAEAAYRTAAAAPKPPPLAALRSLVVQRECAAFLAARLQLQALRPVWWLSQLTITRARATAGPGHGVQVEAVARNVDGPVVNSRITFSRGLHMSCFGLTDARGSVRCTLVDTHPHGPASARDADDEAHAGPLIATLAGSSSADRVELPAVVRTVVDTQADMPHSRRARSSATLSKVTEK